MIVAFIANLMRSRGKNQTMSYNSTISYSQTRRRPEVTYPNPDDTNPAARDTLDVGEAPVTVHSDDRRDELRNAERTHESERRTLHEEEPVRTRDEDEGLRNDRNLEVHDRVELTVVVVEGLLSAARKGDTKLILEERRLKNDGDERDPVRCSLVAAIQDKKGNTHVVAVRYKP